MASRRGSIILDIETVSSKYLLLHTSGDTDSGDLWKIVSRGPRVFSKEEIIRKGYPSPSENNYLVIEIEPVRDSEFDNVSWNFKNLTNYLTGRGSGIPFTSSLTELMKNKIR
jgi:hypothetical protein